MIVVLVITGTIGRITWVNNFVAFMDTMLQMQILQEDTRGLFVPTSIQKLVINTKKHFGVIQKLEKEKLERGDQEKTGNKYTGDRHYRGYRVELTGSRSASGGVYLREISRQRFDIRPIFDGILLSGLDRPRPPCSATLRFKILRGAAPNCGHNVRRFRLIFIINE